MLYVVLWNTIIGDEPICQNKKNKNKKVVILRIYPS